MQREVGGVAAGRRLAAERLRHRADVMRPATAADADVVDADVAGAAREVGHLEPGALERLELDREEVAAVGGVSSSKAGVAGEVRYGTGWAATAMSTAARIASSSGSIVSGPARAVQADDRRAAVGEDPARVDVVVAVIRLGRAARWRT